MAIASLINLLIYLIVLGIIIALVFYVLDAVPVPQPFNRIIKIVATVVVVLILIMILLNLAGIAVPVRADSTTLGYVFATYNSGVLSRKSIRGTDTCLIGHYV